MELRKTKRFEVVYLAKYLQEDENLVMFIVSNTNDLRS